MPKPPNTRPSKPNPSAAGTVPGEGLSRVLAAELHLDHGCATAQLFLTANFWLDRGRPDWITNTDPSDRHSASIGCATLFPNWLCYDPQTSAVS